jgi:hypothetical protein
VNNDPSTQEGYEGQQGCIHCEAAMISCSEIQENRSLDAEMRQSMAMIFLKLQVVFRSPCFWIMNYETAFITSNCNKVEILK